jgi:hypothetical protein
MRKPALLHTLVISLLMSLGVAAGAEEPTPGIPPPLPLPRTQGPITVDGDLSDPGWQGAAVIDTFFETVFGDNREPTVKTVAWVAYDDRFLYLAVRCDDPEPGQIRGPYADRDQVIGTDDNVAIFLDTRGDRRSAQEFRVSPRGIQGDAVYNDANGNEDFSPDFFYDTAARITEQGWQAELRIPLSSLRYPKTDPQTWGIIVWRNYPRDRRYAIYSSPQPRGANCLICRSRELTGLTGLPSSSHLVVAPYASFQDVARAPEPGAPLDSEPTEKNLGVDVKWSPAADTALDATINPDFSQVEADVAQIGVNNRFALFYPEKRPFFLEGVDLFDTPFQAVYTRNITSPRWGARVTGKLGANSYTVLVAEDRGGGSVVMPGPEGSGFAPQDFRSWDAIVRIRRDFGGSFAGLLLTDREIEGGGHNRVFGPDVQWRPGQRDILTGQLLVSDTRTPDRPELASEWDGRSLTSHALHLAWRHNTPGYDWRLQYRDVGDDFRADLGFIPRVGYRHLNLNGGFNFYPTGVLSFFKPYLVAEQYRDREGKTLSEAFGVGAFGFGWRNLQGEVDLSYDRLRTDGRMLARRQVMFVLQVDPSRRFTRIGVQGFLGEDIDLANVRLGTGGNLTAFATLRPDDHLTLDLNAALSWLDVDAEGRSGARLFTAKVLRLKATYNASARLFLRLIGQYVADERDPSLYGFPVPARNGTFQGSALLSYRINWQTAVFIGYGDDRERDTADRLQRTGRQFFAKISYAFQR